MHMATGVVKHLKLKTCKYTPLGVYLNVERNRRQAGDIYITHIIDEAARMTFRNKAEKITQLIIEEAIRETKPSISLEMIRAHEAIRDRFNGNTEEQPQRRIGFKQ